MSLRKRLRDQAAKELKVAGDDVYKAAAKIAEKHGVNTYDLLRITAGGRTDSIVAKAITDMANHKEAELERIYNDQIGLDLSESGGTSKKGKAK